MTSLTCIISTESVSPWKKQHQCLQFQLYSNSTSLLPFQYSPRNPHAMNVHCPPSSWTSLLHPQSYSRWDVNADLVGHIILSLQQNLTSADKTLHSLKSSSRPMHLPKPSHSLRCFGILTNQSTTMFCWRRLLLRKCLSGPPLQSHNHHKINCEGGIHSQYVTELQTGISQEVVNSTTTSPSESFYCLSTSNWIVAQIDTCDEWGARQHVYNCQGSFVKNIVAFEIHTCDILVFSDQFCTNLGPFWQNWGVTLHLSFQMQSTSCKKKKAANIEIRLNLDLFV
jgi:hypothetical protein